MIPAFAEAIRATTQPCTLLLLLPALLMAVIAGGRWAASFAICLGAVLGGWLFIANVVSLSERQLQLSGILVAVAIGATTAAPFVPWLTWLERPSAQAAVAGSVAIDPSPRTAQRAALIAGGVALVVAGALAIGRHNELVVHLTRWTSSEPE